jgi:hypothetical protein
MATYRSLYNLPPELVVYIGTLLDLPHLRILRLVSQSFCSAFTATAFRTLLVRPRSSGFRQRIAPLHLRICPTSTFPTVTERGLHDVVPYVKVIRIELGNSTVHEGIHVYSDSRCHL